jgi:hypothetical protein
MENVSIPENLRETVTFWEGMTRTGTRAIELQNRCTATVLTRQSQQPDWYHRVVSTHLPFRRPYSTTESGVDTTSKDAGECQSGMRITAP